jgi:hypothetical protein
MSRKHERPFVLIGLPGLDEGVVAQWVAAKVGSKRRETARSHSAAGEEALVPL